MAKTILNTFQQKVLQLFIGSPLAKKFYLSGGTALAEYYLQHRFSEDLDFFTQEEIAFEDLQKFIKMVAEKNKIEKIDFEQGFALDTFFLTEKLSKRNKIDFGQYPFEPISPLENKNGLMVESFYDIAINKVQTIVTRPRLRDFIDLYFIFEKQKAWSFAELLKKRQEKFEMRVDALQIGQNLLQVKTLADMPVMIKKVDPKKVQDFFMNEVKKLEKDIWE